MQQFANFAGQKSYKLVGGTPMKNASFPPQNQDTFTTVLNELLPDDNFPVSTTAAA